MMHPILLGKIQSDVTQPEPEAMEETLMDTLAEESGEDIEQNAHIPSNGIYPPTTNWQFILLVKRISSY